MKKSSEIVILLFLVTNILYCQNLDDNFDFYEYSDKLWKNLKMWQNQNFKEQILEETDFDNIFEPYDYSVFQTSPDTFHLIAKLPVYMDILTTKISFQFTQDLSDIERFDYIPDITYCDSVIIFDDSIKVKIIRGEKFSGSAINLLNDRFFLYRTLGLPKKFRPEYLKGNQQVKLFFHARDVDSLIYNSGSQWIKTMNRLSQYKIVYAGPLSIVFEDDMLTIDFYVLITTKEAYGHHFFLIKEVLYNENDELSIESIVVDFYPYVRVDNLLSLYGVDSSKVCKKPFPININRK